MKDEKENKIRKNNDKLDEDMDMDKDKDKDIECDNMNDEKELGMTVQFKANPNDIYLIADVLHIMVDRTEAEFDSNGDFSKHPIIYNYCNKNDVLYDDNEEEE